MVCSRWCRGCWERNSSILAYRRWQPRVAELNEQRGAAKEDMEGVFAGASQKASSWSHRMVGVRWLACRKRHAIGKELGHVEQTEEVVRNPGPDPRWVGGLYALAGGWRSGRWSGSRSSPRLHGQKRNRSSA